MDIRYALRMLARTPGFTVMAAASLALGIGITTIVFTVYSAIAFRQLSVKAPGEIERLQWHSDGFPSNEFSWSEYQRLASGARSFSSAIAISGQQTIVCKLPDAGPARTEIAHARFVSPNYFDVSGIGAALG